MRKLFALLSFITCVACAAEQPASARTVAAFNVPLPTATERQTFLAVVEREALAEGLHLDAAPTSELRRTSEVMPEVTMTAHATVWRGTNDSESEAVLMDWYDHLGQVWIMFSRGCDPELATRFRERVMAKVVQRWPDTLSLPIAPTGAIPLWRDLRKTPQGYKVAASAASAYDIPPGSPLIAGK